MTDRKVRNPHAHYMWGSAPHQPLIVCYLSSPVPSCTKLHLQTSRKGISAILRPPSQSWLPNNSILSPLRMIQRYVALSTGAETVESRLKEVPLSRVPFWMFLHVASRRW